MRVLYSKFSEYACQQANGRHTMIGIFDDIRVAQIPVDHPPFFLNLELEFEATEGGGTMSLDAILMDEDGKDLVKIQSSGPVPKSNDGNPLRMHMVIGIQPIRFEKAGNYRLDVIYNGMKVGEERLPIMLVAPPPPQSFTQ